MGQVAAHAGEGEVERHAHGSGGGGAHRQVDACVLVIRGKKSQHTCLASVRTLSGR